MWSSRVDVTEPPKRWKECIEKIAALTQSAFGDKVEVMYELQSLATAPEAQGKGFASALVTTVTDMVRHLQRIVVPASDYRGSTGRC